MRKWALALALCILAGAVLGCLEFDEQTVYIEHDQANDRLILIFNYMGIFDDGSGAGELAEALEQRTVAVIDTWPFSLSVPELREALADPDEDIPEDVRTRTGWILDEIAVRNAGFYTDPQGRLCAGQVVVIEHASRTIPLINRVINRLILEECRDTDDRRERALADLARRGHEWVKLDGHALGLSFPMTEEELAEGRPVLVGDFLGQDGISEVGLGDLLASPVLVWHEDDLLRVRLGYRSMPSELVTRPAVGDYRPNLEEHVAETYGLHLDANLARYLLEPDAPAQTEEEEAARLMTPRLTQRQRARVLVHALKSGPSDALWAKLREEPLPEGVTIPAGKPSDDELLTLWQEWLESRPVPRAPE